jgi:hypothetical protein
MKKPKDKANEREKKPGSDILKPSDSAHLGSSNAFEETENPTSKDNDNISDERLDEILGE